MSSSRWDVPGDWDGKAWACYTLAWPQSEGYRLLLHSILYSLTRGRDYDETAGVIRDAQAVGWSIFDENVPLVECGNGGSEPEIIEVIKYVDRLTGGGFAGLMERLNMLTKVFIDYDSCELVVQSGQCCEQRFSLACVVGAGTTLPQPGEDDFPDLPDGFDSATACTKATRIVATLANIVDAMTDAAYGTVSPLSVMVAARAREPSINFGDSRLFSAATAAINVTIAGVVEEAEDPEFQQVLRCKLQALFDAGPAGITSAQYGSAKDVVIREAQAFFPYGTYGLLAAPLQVLWGDTMTAIGAGDARALTTALAYGDDNCACPGDFGGLYFGPLSFSFPVSNANDGNMSHTRSEENAKATITWSGTSSTGSTDRYWRFQLLCLSPVTWVTLKYHNDGLHPTTEWRESYTANDWPGINRGDFLIDAGVQGATETVIEETTDYYIVKHEFAGQKNLNGFGYIAGGGARWPGRYAPNPFSGTWSVEIVGYG